MKAGKVISIGEHIIVLTGYFITSKLVNKVAASVYVHSLVFPAANAKMRSFNFYVVKPCIFYRHYHCY